uniref:F-actin-capping protein subunit alpha n=1 Tax=Cucumis melo TaxID=3656 RepID=A0A9I9CIP5_CUCME
MADEEVELSDEQKKEIAKWFLLNAPAGEIQFVAKDVKKILNDDELYHEAASEAFPQYNKSHMICIEMPGRVGDVIITPFNELEENEFLDPRTAQVAIIDNIKQVCTEVRHALDEELPSAYVEEFRCAVDMEVSRYVGEAYPKGVCSVYCVNGKDVEGPESDFELAVVIAAARHSPQNFCNGSWRSTWNIEFKGDFQSLEIRGKMQVFSAPEDCAVAIANIIRHHEAEYLASLETSYSNLPDTTFKDLRRKLPVTRTLFPWHNTSQFSLTRDIAKELGIGK